MSRSWQLAILSIVVLVSLWWFSGGSVLGQLRESPAEKSALFVWQNFNSGLAVIFDAFANLFR